MIDHLVIDKTPGSGSVCGATKHGCFVVARTHVIVYLLERCATCSSLHNLENPRPGSDDSDLKVHFKIKYL